ncbi:MAG: alpha/beta hydrolase [Pseudonocardiaceae bacterium]
MYQLNTRAQDLANRYGDGGQVTTVTWIGYEAPQWGELTDPSHSVALDNAAKAGAANLDGFLNGIGASHDVANRPLHLTALGHSYGSLTTGIALQHQTPVHDAVVFGSPGMDINDVHDLKVPDGHVYSELSRGDFVSDFDIADHFGVSPYSLSGINHLSTGNATSVDGQSLAAGEGHSDYLNDKSTSQYNIAAITAGRSDLAIIDRPTPGPPEAVPAPPSAPPQ